MGRLSATMLYLTLCMLIVYVSAYQFHRPTLAGRHLATSTRLFEDSTDVRREMDIFFERAAIQGGDSIAKLDPKERAERVMEGMDIEDEIFSTMMKLESAQQRYMAGEQGEGNSIESINEMKQSIEDLKKRYVAVVGGDERDRPLYFGKIPDSLQ